MSNTQFWHSSKTYYGCKINTYYLAEKKLWLFSATDIHNVIDRINSNHDTTDNLECNVKQPISKVQIHVFQNDQWETIDVLLKEDIFEVTKSSSADEAVIFEQWVKNLCCNVPEGCILSNSSKEYKFMNLATNRFLDLYKEINNCSFMNISPEIRLYKIRDYFSVYTELLLYPPIKEHVDFIKKTRSQMESVISNEFIKFIRNILSHFPFFTTWDEIYISKQLINWASEGQSIDKFLKKYQGHEDVQYRFKVRSSKEWRYPTIKFPPVYNDDNIFLKDMVNEKDGILLCAILMFNVVSSQIIEQSELPNNIRTSK